jgi:hypothetical protein
MPKLFFSILCFIVLFSSCQKESAIKNISANGYSDMSLVKNANLTDAWYATYGTFNWNNEYIPQDTLHEDSLIHNGYISIPYRNPSYSATINYNIPQEHYLNGDSIAFRFVISDSSDEQIITLNGSSGYVSVDHFKETWGVYTGSFGQSVYTGYQSVINFTPVLIVLKKHVISIYVGNENVYKTKYTGELIGKLQSIELKYSTSLRCNDVSLFNSYTQKLIMKEGFNLKGESHTVYF